MKKIQFTDEQILAILKKSEQRTQSILEFCKEHQIGQATFYKWKSKYRNLESNSITSVVEQLNKLKEENHLLKKLYAEERIKTERLKEKIDKYCS